MRLLLLESDRELGARVHEHLGDEGHLVDWCPSIEAAWSWLGLGHDALVVSQTLVDGCGLEWVRRLRRSGDRTPILMLGRDNDVGDRIRSLDGGVDDHLPWPVEPAELAARIRAVRRRAAGAADSYLDFGEVRLDIAARCAWVRGERTELTAREWALAEALALRAGRIVARSHLEGAVLGPHAERASNALEVHVCSVRRKLGRGLIQTVRGLGYRMSV